MAKRATKRAKVGRVRSGVEMIAAERKRQVSKEGWSPDHDDSHGNGEIGDAAAGYLTAWHEDAREPKYWPLDWEWKPKDRISNLVRAGALIAAEIDREIRLARKGARR